MKVKCHVLEEDVAVTFTPEEIQELIIICEGDIVFNTDAMREYPKGSKGWYEYDKLRQIAKRMQDKIIAIRNTGPIKEVEI